MKNIELGLLREAIDITVCVCVYGKTGTYTGTRGHHQTVPN